MTRKLFIPCRNAVNMLKKRWIFSSVLFVILFIAACSSNQPEFSPESSYASSCPPPPERPSCQSGMDNVILDEEGCVTAYECLPFDEDAFTQCLRNCENPQDYSREEYMPGASNYNACKVSCHTKNAGFTQDSNDCGPILDLPEFYTGSYYSCMTGAGVTDPALCDGSKDAGYYGYCIKLVAESAQDATICNLITTELNDPFSYDLCVKGVEEASS